MPNPAHSELAFISHPSLFGREQYEQTIREVIAIPSHCCCLYFIGVGGSGKTRCLQLVEKIQRDWTGTPFLWVSLDLYHSRLHSPDGIQAHIAQGLSKALTEVDPTQKAFVGYHEKHAKYLAKQRDGVGGSALAEFAQQRDEQFMTDYRTLAKEYRLVITIDTTEKIEFESDIAQKIYDINFQTSPVKDWINHKASSLPNTVILLAGRPKPGLEKSFDDSFKSRDWNYRPIMLGQILRPDADRLIDHIHTHFDPTAKVLSSEFKEQIFKLSGGLPIRLILLMQLILHSENDLSFLRQDAKNPEAIDQALIGYLAKQLPKPYDIVFEYLLLARKGLDRPLLRALVGDQWSDATLDQLCTSLAGSALVKVQRDGELFFLHDELYDIFDRSFTRGPGLGKPKYTKIIDYYRHLPEANLPLAEAQEYWVARLYYELMHHPEEGYLLYRRLSNEAIYLHYYELYLRLREEVLGFINRYARQESEFFNTQIADQVDCNAFDRLNALFWIQLYMGRGKNIEALAIAEKLYQSTEPAFAWQAVKDDLYRAHLLLLIADARAATHAPEELTKAAFIEAKKILKSLKVTLLSTPESWWREQLLGMLYNRFGYFHRSRGRFGKAIDHYRRALRHYNELTTPQRAQVLVNLAYLQALLGKIQKAEPNIQAALRILETLKSSYRLGLCINAHSLILTLKETPRDARFEALKARDMFERMEEPRGIGRAYIAIGFALRAEANKWKRNLTAYPHEVAIKLFSEAETNLKQAIDIFSSSQSSEPENHWQALNELASVYCDLAWLQWKMGDHAQAYKSYTTSIRNELFALKVAKDHDLPFQETDSYDDLAQAYGDRSFLDWELGHEKEAIADRQKAEGYLKEAEKTVPEKFLLGKVNTSSLESEEADEDTEEEKESGEPYWLVKGKAHFWRALWQFRDLERTGELSLEKHPEKVSHAIRGLIIAMSYFQCIEGSANVARASQYFSEYTQRIQATPEWATQQVQAVAKEYGHQNMRFLNSLIDDVLGV